MAEKKLRIMRKLRVLKSVEPQNIGAGLKKNSVNEKKSSSQTPTPLGGGIPTPIHPISYPIPTPDPRVSPPPPPPISPVVSVTSTTDKETHIKERISMPENEQNPPPPPVDSQTPHTQSEEAPWHCDQCGAIVAENDDTCPKCHTSLIEEEEDDEEGDPYLGVADEDDQEMDDTGTDDADDEEHDGAPHPNYLSDDAAREVVLSFYTQNPDIAPREIYEKLKRDNLRDLRGKYIDKHYIAGLKALFYQGRGQRTADKRPPVHPQDIIKMQQQAQAQPAPESAPPAGAPVQQQPTSAQNAQYGALQVQTVPQPAPQPIPIQGYAPGTKILTNPTTGNQWVMPVKKTTIEVLIEGFERASAKGDLGAMSLFADNLSRAVERADESSASGSRPGPMDKFAETMIGVMGKSFEDKVVGKGGKGENEFEKVKGYFTFFKDLQGGQGDVDPNVQMASIITKGIEHGITETRKTILQVSGHSDDNEPEPCPTCNRLVPVDALLCPYCGTRFETEQAPAVPAQQPVPQIPQYTQQRQPQYMTPSQIPKQYAPQVPAYAPPQVAPQVQQPAQAPTPAMPQEAQPMIQPAVYDGVLKFDQKELDSYKGYIKKLASAITHKLDILTPITFLWPLMEDKNKKWAMVAVILGEQKIYFILNQVAPQLPDMAKEIAILNSVDGHSVVSEALTALEAKIVKEGMKIPRTELKAMADELEYKLGFQIPE